MFQVLREKQREIDLSDVVESDKNASVDAIEVKRDKLKFKAIRIQ